MGRGRTRGEESAVHQRSVVCMWPYLCRIFIKSETTPEQGHQRKEWGTTREDRKNKPKTVSI